MKTILATAYAINPYKGSEDGMGWNFIYQIARYNKVITVTRENNKPQIEKYMFENPDSVYENISFVYFDLPYWVRFWKKGSRGAMLYFWLWQKKLPAFIRKQDVKFDIVHNVNFHNDWTPSYIWKLNKPMVWGPIGHHPHIPHKYLKNYRKIYLMKNIATYFSKILFWNLSWSLKQTVKNSSHIICMNKSVPRVLKLTNKKFTITPSVATQDFGFNPNKENEKFTLISAGRLVPLKGFDLSIRAFAEFLNNQTSYCKGLCKLIIVGTGPELNNFKKMAIRLDIEKNVTFIEWVERAHLMDMFKNASAFIFPSHEGAGMVVAEALSFGLPVLCLDNCGPGEFINQDCGIAVSYKNYNQTLKELASGIEKLFLNPEHLKKLSLNARKRFETNFNWDLRGEEFKKIYLNL